MTTATAFNRTFLLPVDTLHRFLLSGPEMGDWQVGEVEATGTDDMVRVTLEVDPDRLRSATDHDFNRMARTAIREWMEANGGRRVG